MNEITWDIGVDIDDCLMPWAATIHDLCVEAGITGGRPYTQWHMWEDYGCSREQWVEVVQQAAQDGMYETTQPYQGVQAGLKILRHLGHRVHLVTARGCGGFAPDWFNETVQESTVAWAHDWSVEYDSLTFSADKTLVRANYFVDDSLRNYDALDAAGVEVWMVNRPHNAPWSDHRRRLKSFAHFAGYIRELTTYARMPMRYVEGVPS